MANKFITSFAGGMNSHTAPLILKDNESELIVNYNLDKTGTLSRRNGYELYASNTLFHTSGLISALNANTKTNQAWLTTNDAAFATATKRITYYYKIADGTWTATDDNNQEPFLPTTGAANELYKTRFVFFLNYVFRLNGGDAPKSFLITTPQTATTTNLTDNETSAALAITPSLGVAFSNRVFFNDTADGKKSRIYYSTLGISGGTIAWNTDAVTGQWRDINPDDGDFITAFEPNGSHLLIFKNNALYRYIFDQVEADKVIGVGTTSQESVKTNYDVGITFFANPKGVYTYSGGGVKLISRKIQEYVDAVPAANWIYCAGGVDKEHYYLSVGDVTVNGRTISNAVFVYHIFLDSWTIYSLAEQPTCFIELGTTYPTQQLGFGTADGGVYRFTTATSDVDGTTTVNINTEVLTKEHLLTMPEKTTLENIDIVAIQGGDTKVSYQIDRNLMGKEGDFISCKERLNKRINTLRVGKEMSTVRLRLADNSQRASIIEGYNLEHTPKKDR